MTKQKSKVRAFPLSIIRDDDLCASDCPFKDVSGCCMLFKEPLDARGYYDSIDGYEPCRQCNHVVRVLSF